MVQQTLPFTTGYYLAHAGMQQALTTAENASPNWFESAYTYFRHWLGTLPPGYTFLLEDARIRAEQLGTIPIPPSKRAWANVVYKARKEGLIVKNGVRSVTNPKAHAAMATEWRKL